MFFRKKKEVKELLYKKNIITGCGVMEKEEVIRTLGNMLVETGYVNPSYVDGMLERENTVSTFMGNELALPHGVEAVKNEVLSSGIAVMIFPEGIDWNGEVVKIAVGIAGVGEEHLQILSIIAEKVLDEVTMKQLLSGTENEVYEILKGDD